jgi:hypothetical protein
LGLSRFFLSTWGGSSLSSIKKIYIAGPMSGVADWNFPAFFEAERQLVALGYSVVNPAHNDGPTVELALESAGKPSAPNHTWAYYMKRDLPHVLDVDALCVLPGWQNSKGASLEVQVAQAIGLPLMILRDGQLVPRVEVVGLSGWARSGKDTLANHLVENRGFVKMSFADPIREALVRLDPRIEVKGLGHIGLAWAVRTIGWETLKDESPDVRVLMQRMGTEVGRQMFSQDFWVDAAMKRAEDGAKIVFADCRFPNEADAIKKLGGKVVRVVRDGVAPANAHVSETALDDYDFDVVIDNGSSLAVLFDNLEKSLGL